MKTLIAIGCLILLSGCAAAKLSLAKRNLDVQTRTSNAIFLQPLSNIDTKRPTLYLEVRSGVMEFDRAIFRQSVQEELTRNESGYELTDDPNAADFHMLASISNLEKADPTAAQLALEEGYGGATVLDTFLSAANHMSYHNHHHDHKDFFAMLAAAIVIGTVEAAVNSAVKDVYYILISDVEVSENSHDGAHVTTTTRLEQAVSDGGTAVSTTKEVDQRIKYRTRIVTTANQANLKLDQARESMFLQTAYAIAGIFAKGTALDSADDKPDPPQTMTQDEEPVDAERQATTEVQPL